MIIETLVLEKTSRMAFKRPKNRKLEKAVRKIFQSVESKGDAALKEYAEKFDSCKVKGIVIGKSEMEKIASAVDAKTLRALKEAKNRIEAFAKKEFSKSWTKKSGSSVVGKKVTPIGRVGVYVPGGSAAYPSTALMCCVPARVAGVGEITVCTPPKEKYDPAVFAALELCGIEKVFAVGGVQAIAAMCFGTQTVPRCDKIVGPGNAWVNEAKKLAASLGVAIDSPAGPTEVLIIADGSANPEWVAADLLAQAEHDADASAVLATTSKGLAKKVAFEIEKQVPALPRKAIAAASLKKNGKILLAKSMGGAIAYANAYAPEHLEIIAKDAGKIVEKITNAGAIFIGKWSCEALGDYGFGPNHVLPTGGAAKAFSGLSANSFAKETSVIRASERDARKFSATAATLARAEGLDGHAYSIEKRVQKVKSGK